MATPVRTQKDDQRQAGTGGDNKSDAKAQNGQALIEGLNQDLAGQSPAPHGHFGTVQ